MPSSTPNPETLATDLREFLANALPGSRSTLGEKRSHLQPLVLLETNHLVAGFGFSNGDPKGNYETLYQEFKTAFKAARQNWEKLDLNFVFCVQPQTPDLEKLCSRIETDVYFCRKFVLPLGGALSDTLARLPFLPLTPITGQSLRPPSAQSFLLHCGLSGSFAKDIVVQRERAAEAIVENCIAGVYGPAFEPSHGKVSTMEAAVPPSEAVRLKSIEVSNFRAYRTAQHFDIGKKVTLLYGPNGFGKTSFFDAIDFAATGDIGRLELTDSQFANVARHLDAPEDTGQVSLNFATNGSERRITRTVGDRKNASLDGRSKDRKLILAELTGRDILQSDRVENFINLFRATHLFNQEDPELVKGFRDDCRLEPEIVSRMLAHQDYVNALKKLDGIISNLTSRVEKDEGDAFQLNEELTPLKQELARLSLSSPTGSDQQLLGEQIKQLEAKLHGLQLPPIETETPTPQATLRHWRANLEARVGEVRSRFEQLSELLKEISPLVAANRDLHEKRTQLTDKETALSNAGKLKDDLESAQKKEERAVAELASSLQTVQARIVALEWHKANKSVYTQLKAKQLLFTTELSECVKLVEKLRTSEEAAGSEFRKMESLEKQLATEFELKQKSAKLVSDLAESVPLWHQNRKQLDELGQLEATLGKTLEEVKLLEAQYLEALVKEQASEAGLLRHISESDKSQTDLKVLLANLQSHITDGNCPVCGDNHGTKEELLKRIDRQTKNDPSVSVRNTLNLTRDRIKQFETDVVNNRQKQGAVRQQLDTIHAQKKILSEDIHRFVGSVAQSTNLPSPELAHIPDAIAKESSKIKEELGSLSQKLKVAADSVLTANGKLAEIKEQLSKQLSDEAAKRSSLLRTNTELETFRNDPAWKIISLDVTDEERDVEAKNSQDTIENLRSTYASRQSGLPKFIEAATKARQDFVSIREQVQNLRVQINGLSKTTTQSTAKFDQAKISPNSGESELLGLIAEQSKLQAELNALLNTASNLELALDSATTAAALSAIQNSIKTKEKEFARLSARLASYKPWSTFFIKVHRLLSQQQNSAIEAFTNEYGPRTSVIQRRLRSVYGFDDVEIHTRDSAIHVRVSRNGSELRPIDYFSQSQQQTLLLGLFLTACISQTWSGFAPVFMDDPVTHFDDLNTYAFLDLVVGLLESDPKEPQFIISTCDEKLLQLARQKFRHLGPDAIFYRFEAIGSNGPIVQQIPNV